MSILKNRNLFYKIAKLAIILHQDAIFYRCTEHSPLDYKNYWGVEGGFWKLKQKNEKSQEFWPKFTSYANGGQWDSGAGGSLQNILRKLKSHQQNKKK